MAKNDNTSEKKQSILTMDVGDLLKKDRKKGAPASKTSSAKPKKGAVKSTKRTMNFVHHKSSFNIFKILPIALVLIICLAIFAKVGFLDQLSKKTLAYSELAAKQEQLAAINTRLVGYDELANQYNRYSYGLMNETEINLVSRMDVLELLQKQIAPRATIENFAVNNNVLTMNIHGITLEEASTMVKNLENTDLVSRATVNSATAADAIEARIFISITLTKPEKEAQ